MNGGRHVMGPLTTVGRGQDRHGPGRRARGLLPADAGRTHLSGA